MANSLSFTRGRAYGQEPAAKGLHIAEATDADLATRMMESRGQLFWASPARWLMLDAAQAKRGELSDECVRNMRDGLMRCLWWRRPQPFPSPRRRKAELRPLLSNAGPELCVNCSRLTLRASFCVARVVSQNHLLKSLRKRLGKLLEERPVTCADVPLALLARCYTQSCCASTPLGLRGVLCLGGRSAAPCRAGEQGSNALPTLSGLGLGQKRLVEEGSRASGWRTLCIAGLDL